ncbi:MAG: hypothetical protein ABIR18_02955 [Chitinophagaceae bacterium]
MSTKLIQFSLLIQVNGRQREFNFRQRSVDHYDGNTTDERGDRYYFKLVMERGEWIFADKDLPPWLKEFESHVGQAIVQNNL